MLQRLLEEQRNRRKQIAGTSRQARRDIDPFLGTSVAIRQLAEDARKVLGSESPILIQGETGTGKGVLAKWLHDHSPRSDRGVCGSQLRRAVARILGDRAVRP